MPTTAPTTEFRRHSQALLYLKTEAEQVDGGVLVPALLFTDGDFTDAIGVKGSYTRRDLNRIVSATKKYFSTGGDIPIFESNHDLNGAYSNDKKIGKLAVDEGLTVEEITEANLPDPRFTDLIGRYGIFGYGLITRTDAVERYSQHLIKPLSIAFDPSGGMTEGNKWAVFEVSAVPWGAVRGAMFFAKMLTHIQAPDGYKATQTANGIVIERNELTGPVRHALTLDGAMAERRATWEGDAMGERMYEALMVFSDVVRAIRHTTDEELQGRSRDALTRQAIADLSAKLTELLGVAAAELPVVALSKFTKETPTVMATDDTTPAAESTPTEPKAETVDLGGLMKRIEELEAANKQQQQRAEEAEQVVQHLKAEAESLRFQRKVSDRVTRLHGWAQNLVRLGKLPPAAIKEWFPESEAIPEAVVRFSKAIESEEVEGDPLDEIEAALKYADKFAEPVKFGSAMSREKIGDNPLLHDDKISDTDQATVNEVVKKSKATRYY